MAAEERLDDILDAWQEAFEKGTDVPPSNLCQDAPDLLPEVERRVAQLRLLARLRPRDHGDSTMSLDEPAGDTATHTGGATPSAPITLPGTSPPGYEILEELGHGGMGVVYKARQIRLNRVVALKMVLGGIRAKPADLLRFRVEGEAVARLDHPNVVQVHEVGTHEGMPYLTLEYCSGGSLDVQLAKAPLPARKAAETVLALAHAVHAAHLAGILHRDLKPANILLTGDGTPKVSDFGLAKWADAGDGVTVTGSVVGTPSFMAPEAASGNLKAVNWSADVYALGAILYTCLTGRPPFKGATAMDTLDQVRTIEPVRVRDLQPGVPRDLETICLKCLQKGTDRRYVSAAALADELQRFLDRKPIQARPVNSLERAWRWCRRNPAVALLLVGVLATSMAGTAVSLWFADAANARRQDAEEAERTALREKWEADLSRASAQKEKAEADKARATALQEKSDAEVARKTAVKEQRRAEWAAYISQISLSQREWELGNAPAAIQLLATTKPDLRGWEYRYLERLFDRDRNWASQHAGSIVDLAMSPDGDRIATSDGRSVTVWDARTGKMIATWDAKFRGFSCFTFSPDGKSLLTGDGTVVKDNRVSSGPGQVVTWNVQTGKVQGSVITLPGTVNNIRFLSAKHQLLVGCGDGRVCLLSYPSGEIRQSFVTPHSQDLRIAVSSDGKLIASAGLRGGIDLRELRDGKFGDVLSTVSPTEEVRLGRETHVGLEFSPDDKCLVSTRNGVHLWNVASGKQLWSSAATATRARWTPSGAFLITASEDRVVSVWDPKTGHRAKRFQGHLKGIFGLGTTDDMLVSGSSDGKLISWQLNGPAEPQEIHSPGQGWFNDVRFTPDGKTLFSGEGGSQTGIRLWDPSNGRERAFLKGHTEYVSTVALSRNTTNVFSSSKDGTVRKWDLTAGKTTAFKGHTGCVVGVVCPPTDEWMATGGQDGHVRVWQPIHGVVTQTLVSQPVPVSRISLDAEGRQLAASFDDGQIVVWDTATWREVARLSHGDVRFSGDGYPTLAIAFSPNGRFLVSAGTNRTLRVWELATKSTVWVKEPATLPAPILSIGFLPDGKQFVTGGGSWGTPGEAKVWNTETGENTFTLRASTREILGIAVNPVDEAIATCSHEGSIKLWGSDVHTPQAIVARHRTLWQQAEKRGDWFAAATQLTALAQLEPFQADLRLRAAHLWKLAGRPELAAQQGVAAYLLNPSLPASPARLASPEGPGRWRIDGQELLQKSRDRDAWLLFGSPEWTDFDLEVRVKYVGGDEGPCIGFRMSSCDEAYAVVLGGGGNNHAGLVKWSGGKVTYPSVGEHAFEAGKEYRVKVEVRGDQLRFLLDGKEIHAARDGTQVRGRIGVRSKDSSHRFSDFKVTAPDGKILFEGLPHIVAPEFAVPSNGSDPAVNADAHFDRGLALRRKSDLAGATAAFRAAIALAPTRADYHSELADALSLQNDTGPAYVAACEAIRLDPSSGKAYHALGHVLRARGDLVAWTEAAVKAVQLDGESALFRVCVGTSWRVRGDPTRAVDTLTDATRRHPRASNAWSELALALIDDRQAARAVVAGREGVRLAPNNATAHAALGLALRANGQLADALAAFKSGAALPGGTNEHRAAVRVTERWIALDKQFQAVADGTVLPKSPAEAIEFADLCRQPFKNQFDLAVQLFRRAFAADRKLLEGEVGGLAAAGAAVLLADGHDLAAEIDQDDRFRLHDHARAWLAADLAASLSKAEKGTAADRRAVVRRLEGWQRSPELRTVRDADELATLPPLERMAWRALWREVGAAIEASRPPVAPPPRLVPDK